MDTLNTTLSTFGAARLTQAPQDNRDRNDQNQDISNARQAILSAPDRRHAFWSVFKDEYLDFRAGYWKDSWSNLWMDGKRPTSLGVMLHRLEESLGMLSPVSLSDLERKVDAERSSGANPVEGYLMNLHHDLGRTTPQGKPVDAIQPLSDEDWNGLAKRVFGTDNELHQVLLAKWLISAVARVMCPGCPARGCLVLKGAQNAGKTAFFKILGNAPARHAERSRTYYQGASLVERFATLHAHQPLLEQQRIAQANWILELGEVESTFRSKDVAALKAFISETHDVYREMYKDLGAPKPRHIVFGATTNKDAFLNDPTGSTRFWVIDLGNNKVDRDYLESNADAIWLKAYQLFLEGESWELNDTTSELLQLENEGSQEENSLLSTLAPMIRSLEQEEAIAFTSSDILTALGIPITQHRKFNKELAEALKHLGYVRKSFRSKARGGWHYVKPEEPQPQKVTLTNIEAALKATR